MFIRLYGKNEGDNTLTGKTCLFVGLGLLAVVVVQTVVHYLSDRLQRAAGFMIFADKRMELGLSLIHI